MQKEKIYLSYRRILKISGPNQVNFLNNILTSDISKLNKNEIVPSALLTPQGRILFDLLISLEHTQKTNITPSILIECDISQIDDLFKKLKIYNLRNEVNIEKSEHKIFVTIDPENFDNILFDKRFFDIRVGRIYENKELKYDLDNDKALNTYHLLRYKYCVPEGPIEIINNVSLPLEINLDLLGGINFEKGCFIGQEVNARIKWRGLVKKKYVPITFKNDNLSNLELKNLNDKEIYLNDIIIGSLISMAYNNYEDLWYGIAIIKLTNLYKFEENNDLECKLQNLKLKIKFPQYMLPLPKKSETS